MTFVDYFENKWHINPTIKQLGEIANIISWNIWQMDGLTDRVPLSEADENNVNTKCKIYNWKEKESILYESLKM